jgi:hypothetical protein
MLISAALRLVACFAHNFVRTILLLLIFRILHGAGYSIFSTANGTAVSYVVPLKRISEGMGYFMLGNVLTMAVESSIELSLISNRNLAQFHYLFNTVVAVCAGVFSLVIFLK